MSVGKTSTDNNQMGYRIFFFLHGPARQHDFLKSFGLCIDCATQILGQNIKRQDLVKKSLKIYFNYFGFWVNLLASVLIHEYMYTVY